MSIIKKAIVGLCLGAFALAPVGLMAEVTSTSTPSQELAWWGRGYGYGYGYSPYYYGGYGYGGYGYGGYYGYGYGCGGCCGGCGGSSWPYFF